MSRRKKRETTDENTKNSVFDMSTRQLRAEIRKRTASVNVRISEYRDAVLKGEYTKGEQEFIETTIESVKTATAFRKSHTDIYYIPKGKKGEIGLGLSTKTKSELQKQLASLRRFEKNDILTPQGKENWSDRVQKQYDTFKERYDENMTQSEYQDMIDTMNIIKEVMKDYGYEDFGVDYARKYAKANEQGKQKFIKYVEQAKKEKAGSTANEILDRVAELLRENKQIDEDE